MIDPNFTGNLIFCSNATDSDVEYYTTGSCHWLAVAIHRELGWPMIIVTDNSETYWQDPNDDDALIPSIVHVYSLSPNGQAWDIFGCREVQEVQREVEERWFVGSYGNLIVDKEIDLAEYVGCWGEDSDGDIIDRPLPEYTNSDIAEAALVVKRLFPHMSVASNFATMNL